eukprot:TRINITY_DN753_c0_g2_i1.p1 TRINITY_DN753_c0_g2~~TRINITY_DN753_c0_g2_i1.p1  ORF type:complete len:748 (-),score=108.66 TRINITY_DN753_c0_g2_i1:9-2252(-)
MADICPDELAELLDGLSDLTDETDKDADDDDALLPGLDDEQNAALDSVENGRRLPAEPEESSQLAGLEDNACREQPISASADSDSAVYTDTESESQPTEDAEEAAPPAACTDSAVRDDARKEDTDSTARAQVSSETGSVSQVPAVAVAPVDVVHQPDCSSRGQPTASQSQPKPNAIPCVSEVAFAEQSQAEAVRPAQAKKESRDQGAVSAAVARIEDACAAGKGERSTGTPAGAKSQSERDSISDDSKKCTAIAPLVTSPTSLTIDCDTTSLRLDASEFLGLRALLVPSSPKSASNRFASRLRQLCLSGIDLTDPETVAEPLSQLEALEELDISRNRLQRLPLLQRQRKLLDFDASENLLRSSRGLLHCESLRHVSLAHNQLRRVEQLETLQALEVLDVSHNQLGPTPLIALRPLAACASLRELRVAGNPLANTSAVRGQLRALIPSLAFVDRDKVRYHGGATARLPASRRGSRLSPRASAASVQRNRSDFAHDISGDALSFDLDSERTAAHAATPSKVMPLMSPPRTPPYSHSSKASTRPLASTSIVVSCDARQATGQKSIIARNDVTSPAAVVPEAGRLPERPSPQGHFAKVAALAAFTTGMRGERSPSPQAKCVSDHPACDATRAASPAIEIATVVQPQISAAARAASPTIDAAAVVQPQISASTRAASPTIDAAAVVQPQISAAAASPPPRSQLTPWTPLATPTPAERLPGRKVFCADDPFRAALLEAIVRKRELIKQLGVVP